MILYTLQL